MTTSASSGPMASAFSSTSGPMPRGSPTVTPRRGREPRDTWLVANVDVRRAAQQVEVVLDGELLAQPVADPVLHFVEVELPLRPTLPQLEQDEPVPRVASTDLDHML